MFAAPLELRIARESVPEEGPGASLGHAGACRAPGAVVRCLAFAAVRRLPAALQRLGDAAQPHPSESPRAAARTAGQQCGQAEFPIREFQVLKERLLRQTKRHRILVSSSFDEPIAL